MTMSGQKGVTITVDGIMAREDSLADKLGRTDKR